MSKIVQPENKLTSCDKRETKYVCVIGSSCIDTIGYPETNLEAKGCVPGIVRVNHGGVGRNICENLARLGVKVVFLSAVGKDFQGTAILNELNAIGVDTSHVKVSNARTANYIGCLDEKNELEVAISQMDVIEELDIEYFKSKKEILQKATYCIIDCNLAEVYEYLLNETSTPFILDGTSVAKIMKLKPFLKQLYGIKPDIYEAETISEIKYKTKDDLEKITDYLLDKGVKRIFLTLGKDGAYYRDKKQKILATPEPQKPKNVTGAGDTFLATVVHGLIHDLEIEEMLKLAITSAVLKLDKLDSVNKSLTIQAVKEKLKTLQIKVTGL